MPPTLNVVRTEVRLGRGALLALGLLAIMGLGCATVTLQPPEDARAKTLFLPAAEKGDAVAQFRMGQSYRYGSSGVAADWSESRRWFLLAAEKGYKDAQFALGQMYLAGGPNLSADGTQAVLWLSRGAEQGSASDRLWLAQLLATGRPPVLAPDAEAARRWYERAASESLTARRELGRFWEKGEGGAVDNEKALTWFLLADSATDAARVGARLRPAQVARARKAAEEWRP